MHPLALAILPTTRELEDISTVDDPRTLIFWPTRTSRVSRPQPHDADLSLLIRGGGLVRGIFFVQRDPVDAELCSGAEDGRPHPCHPYRPHEHILDAHRQAHSPSPPSATVRGIEQFLSLQLPVLGSDRTVSTSPRNGGRVCHGGAWQ